MAAKRTGRDAKKKSPEQSGKLLQVLQEWQKLEDTTIKFSEEMGKKTKNRLIRMTMDMIKSDSQKHKVMQQMLIDSLTKEPFVLSPDDLGALSAGLNKHMAAEARSLELADEALQSSELFVTRYILSYLIADEQKHHKMLANLNELKRATVFVT
jgi:rubrerythrin